MLVFEERTKPEYTEKKLSEQGREPKTNSTHIWHRVRGWNPGHIGGRRALSPPRHLYSPKQQTRHAKNQSKKTRDHTKSLSGQICQIFFLDIVKCANKTQCWDGCDNIRGSHNCTRNLIGYTMRERSTEQLIFPPQFHDWVIDSAKLLFCNLQLLMRVHPSGLWLREI